MIAYFDKDNTWQQQDLILIWSPVFAGYSDRIVLDVSGNENHAIPTIPGTESASRLNFEAKKGFNAHGPNRNPSGSSGNKYTTTKTFSAAFPVTYSCWCFGVAINSGIGNRYMTSVLTQQQISLRGAYDWNTGVNVDSNEWTHIAITIDNLANPTIRVYKNGELAASYTNAGTTSTTGTIGLHSNQYNSLAGSPLGGEWRVWIHSNGGNCFDASQIRNLYQLGQGGGLLRHPPRNRSYFANGFKAYWHRRETQLIGGGLK